MEYFFDNPYVRRSFKLGLTQKVRITAIPLTIGKDKKIKKYLF